jgi:hypothetical protein
MARVKPSKPVGGASKKSTASSNGKIVKLFITTKRRGAVMRKKTEKGRKARVTIKLTLTPAGEQSQAEVQQLSHFHLFPKLVSCPFLHLSPPAE